MIQKWEKIGNKKMVRRKGWRFVRHAFHAPDDPPYCVPGPYLHFCLICGSMCSLVGLCVHNIFVEPTKLQCGATPPSLMVIFSYFSLSKKNFFGGSSHYGNRHFWQTLILLLFTNFLYLFLVFNE